MCTNYDKVRAIVCFYTFCSNSLIEGKLDAIEIDVSNLTLYFQNYRISFVTLNTYKLCSNGK